jgi:hypothetical protein
VEPCLTNFQVLISSLKYLRKSDHLPSIYYTFDTPSIDVPWKKFHKLFQPTAELRNLHRISTNRCALIQSVSQSLIWRSRLWKSYKTNCVVRSYVATSFQTFKQINNCCNIKSVSVAVYCCKFCERKQKGNFVDPDSSLVVCGAI